MVQFHPSSHREEGTYPYLASVLAEETYLVQASATQEVIEAVVFLELVPVLAREKYMHAEPVDSDTAVAVCAYPVALACPVIAFATAMPAAVACPWAPASAGMGPLAAVAKAFRQVAVVEADPDSPVAALAGTSFVVAVIADQVEGEDP